MFTISARQGTRPRTAARHAGTRIRRYAAVLAVIVSGLLASAAVVPAAFAMTDPPPGGAGVPQAPVTTVRVVATGGMAGWQITLIAVGAALLAAVAAVLVYRALAARRSPATTA